MKYRRKCVGCGQEFETDHPRQKYCRNIKIKTCRICGKQFEQVCEAQVSNVCDNLECLKLARSSGKPNIQKACKCCGELFTPKTARNSYCGKLHKAICDTCGHEFEYECEKDANTHTCKNCAGKRWKRICKECGKEFLATCPTTDVCYDVHFKQCEICGKEFEVTREQLINNSIPCCSEECTKIKRNAAIKENIKNLEYGWNRATSTFTKLCAYCGKEFETNISNQKYCSGPHYRICKICGKPFELSGQQMFNGTETCSDECSYIARTRTTLVHPDIFIEWESFSSNPEQWIRNTYGDIAPTYYQLSKDLNMAISTIQHKLATKNSEHLVKKYVSTMEQEVINYIKTITSSKIVHNTRAIIRPKELDIYLPEYRFAIECDPTATHNTTKSIIGYDLGISKNYHKDKTDLCQQQNIQLLHLFGYDWIHKQDIMKSIIQHRLQIDDIKIYARHCKIKLIDNSLAYTFLNTNHRQGYVSSSINLGLYYGDELVSIMTFGKSRKSIGYLENSIELLRFCNSLYTTVIGGASKLFKYFVDTYNPFKIISFSDRARTSGKIYPILGFQLDHISEPGYVWVDTKTDKAYHRMNAQKHNIKKFLKYDSIDLSKSETQIMADHGYVQVFDSGNNVWVWSK